jgi:hypothetical protein
MSFRSVGGYLFSRISVGNRLRLQGYFRATAELASMETMTQDISKDQEHPRPAAEEKPLLSIVY